MYSSELPDTCCYKTTVVRWLRFCQICPKLWQNLGWNFPCCRSSSDRFCIWLLCFKISENTLPKSKPRKYTSASATTARKFGGFLVWSYVCTPGRPVCQWQSHNQEPKPWGRIPLQRAAHKHRTQRDMVQMNYSLSRACKMSGTFKDACVLGAQVLSYGILI